MPTGIALKMLGVLLLTLLLLAAALFAGLMLTAPAPRATPDWRLGPPLPRAFGELATTAIDQMTACAEPPCPQRPLLAVLSGLSGFGEVLDALYLYDPGAAAWHSGPNLPTARHHAAASSRDGAIYLAGGAASLSQPWQPERNFWRLGADSDAWEQLEPMPEPRWGHRLVLHAGRLYVIGGRGGSGRVLIHDREDGWSLGAALPQSRDHLSAVVVENRIWAIGGRAPASLARVDIYDTEADRWLPGPPLPAPTSGAAEGVLDGTILVFGGEDPDLIAGGVYDRHWMLDTRVEPFEWTPAPAPPLAVHGADGTVFQGRMVIVGGAGRHGALSVTSWTNTLQILEAGDADVHGEHEPR